MRLFCIILAFMTWLTATSPMEARDRPEEEVAIFYAPVNVLELKAQHPTQSGTKSYPLCPNDFADFLPGDLYDMRQLFAPDGAKFGPRDFVFYNPKRNIVIAAASPTSVRFIKSILDSYEGGGVIADPIQNLLLEGAITVGGRADSSPQLQWQAYGRSGQRSAASALGGSGIGYQLEIEPANMADGASCECNLVLKVFYDGKEYALTTSFALKHGKEQTLLLGTTAQGERVEFRLLIKPTYIEPAESPLRDAKWKAGLLRRLRSAPQSAPH